MLKFLRLYSKWILAVFGSLLMITFLAPTAIQEFFAQRAAKGSTWAEIGPSGKKLGDDVRMESAADLAVVERLSQMSPNTRLPEFVDTRNEAHWHLLAKAADDAGLVPPRGSIGLPPADADQIFRAMGGYTETNERAMARFDGIRNMLGMWQLGASLSDRRIEGIAARLFHTVDARVAVIQASADGMPMPSDADIQTHYASFADVEPGEGRYGFGYRQPNRASLEFLHIPIEAIDAAVEAAGEMNIVELTKHWSSSAAAKGFPTFQRGVPIPDVVREDLLQVREEQMRAQIIKWLTSRQLSGSRALTRDEDGFLVLPDDWSTRQLDFVALVDALPEAFEGLDGVTYRADGGLRPISELNGEDDFPNARTDAFGTPRSVAALVPATKELGGDGSISLQANVTGPILTDADGGIVLFRITEADGARAPLNLAEVRDEIVTDLQRLAHYQELLAQRDSIEATAETSGLLAVSLDRDAEIRRISNISIIDASLFIGLQGRFAARGLTQFPAIGANEDLAEAIVDAALQLPGDDASIGTLPSDQRIQAFDADASLALVITEFAGQTRLDRERFEQVLGIPGTLGLLLQEEFGDIGTDLEQAFGFDVLKERYDFKPLARERDEIDLGLGGDDDGEGADDEG
ncbi:MAG: hypothetical protein AB8G96_06285 [Phycisphaerales bacterium]